MKKFFKFALTFVALCAMCTACDQYPTKTPIEGSENVIGKAKGGSYALLTPDGKVLLRARQMQDYYGKLMTRTFGDTIALYKYDGTPFLDHNVYEPLSYRYSYVTMRKWGGALVGVTNPDAVIVLEPTYKNVALHKVGGKIGAWVEGSEGWILLNGDMKQVEGTRSDYVENKDVEIASEVFTLAYKDGKNIFFHVIQNGKLCTYTQNKKDVVGVYKKVYQESGRTIGERGNYNTKYILKDGKEEKYVAP